MARSEVELKNLLMRVKEESEKIGLKFSFQKAKKKHQFLGAFFIVQLSHPYMTTGKTKALTRRTFVGKGMSLLQQVNSEFSS